MTWVECGYSNTISVPQGAPSPLAKNFTDEFKWLEDAFVKSVFKDVDLFYLSLDEDEAGRLLKKHLSMLLSKEKCRVIKYPPGYKDINEVLVGHVEKKLAPLGKQGVIDCYNNIASVPIAGVVRPHHVLDDMEKIRVDGFLPGLGCGVPEIDKLFTVKMKHITFVTGVPGSGKSVFIRWWLTEMIRFNEKEDLRWAMFTPENRPVAREFAKIVEALTGQYVKKGLENSLSEEAYKTALRFVEKHFFVISPDRNNFEMWNPETKANKINTLDNILKYLEYLKKTENIFGYVIDAWNKIEHEQPKWQTETTFISEQLDRLVAFNDYWDLHGIIIVHPRKIEQVGENYKMPSLYDIKGSSAWKEKADIGILIHRYKLKKLTTKMVGKSELDAMDEDEKWFVMPNAPTIVRTEKIRFEEIGVEDRVRLIMKTGGRFVVDKSKKVFDHEKWLKDNDPDNTPEPGPRPITKNIFGEDDDKDDLPF
jgi:twinkle protein